MWKFSGNINYTCDACGYTGEISVDDFSIECFGGSERQMGAENLYDISYELDCLECESPISFNFEASEYPAELLSFVLNKTTGAQTIGEPKMEHLREIYSAEDLFYLHESIAELIIALKQASYLLDKVTPRQFEEIVAEVFRSKGFEVDLTKRTRDGGKDIIAFHTDAMGIKNKYFVECKRYSESNKISVDIVRSLYGVMNTIDGPNKAIIVTTSTFTDDARKFVKQEATSIWDFELIDRAQLLNWLGDYKHS